MKTPGSSNSVAPRTRNSMPKRVLPQPALPQISVGRPRGRPPPVISSKPVIPVGAFSSEAPFKWECEARSMRSSLGRDSHYRDTEAHDGRTFARYRCADLSEQLACRERQRARAERLFDA